MCFPSRYNASGCPRKSSAGFSKPWRAARRSTPHSPTRRDSPAWIAHYFYRSFEEFIWKFSRGRCDEPLQKALPAVNVPEEFMEKWDYEGQQYRYSDRFKGHAIFVSGSNPHYRTGLLFGAILVITVAQMRVFSRQVVY